MRNLEISKLKAIYFRNQKKRIKAWFIQSAEKRNNTPPIELSHITADIVTSYLLGLRKLNGDPPGYSNYSTHRTSIRHWFRMYRVSVPAEFDSLMGLDFKFLNRKVANRVNDAGGNVQVRIVNYIDERSLVNGMAPVEQMQSIISNSVKNTLGEAGILNLLQNFQQVVPETSASINTYEMVDSQF